MANFIDRRPRDGSPDGKDKSRQNKARFNKRADKYIKKAVQEAISGGLNKDSHTVTIPKEDISEPLFHTGSGGKRTIVHPGNDQFVAGDRVERSKGGGSGSGEGDASDDAAPAEDNFFYQMKKADILKYLFEGLELPNLEETQSTQSNSYSLKRAGYSTSGSPDKMNLQLTKQNSLARTVALKLSKATNLYGIFAKAVGDIKGVIKDSNLVASDSFASLDASPKLFDHIFEGKAHDLYKKTRSKMCPQPSSGMPPLYEGENRDLTAEIKTLFNLKSEHEQIAQLLKNLYNEAKTLEKSYDAVPQFEENDIQFNNFEKQPKSSHKAVVFELMDVSASMTQELKERAKRMFETNEAWLEAQYGKDVEIVRISHTDKARIVDEKTFYESKETGGTKVSAAIDLLMRTVQGHQLTREENTSKHIIQDYINDGYNIYIMQASDGDVASPNDAITSSNILSQLMPHIKYFSYIETPNLPRTTHLYQAYAQLKQTHPSHVGLVILNHKNEILDKFRGLFKKRDKANQAAFQPLAHNYG